MALVEVGTTHTHWQVAVRDQGPGTSPEAQALLFKPFFRDPSANRIDGVGLGLPFVRAVMSRLGGRVVVHSTPGCGQLLRALAAHHA